MSPTGDLSCHINFSWGAVSIGLARRLLACRLCLTLPWSVANPFRVIIQLLFWYCFFNKGFPSYRRLLPITIILIPLIFYANVFNNFTRSSAGGVLLVEKKNLFSTIFEMTEMFTTYDLLDNETSRTTRNLSSRTLLALPLAMSIELPTSEKKFLLGKIIFNTFVWTVPRAIFPEKINFPIMEELIITTFDLDIADTANSLYLYSYVAFGYFGLLIYPMLLFLYWKFMATLIFNREFNPLILIYFASYGFNLFLLLSEMELLALTAALRDMIILTQFLFIFLRLRSKSFIASQKK